MENEIGETSLQTDDKGNQEEKESNQGDTKVELQENSQEITYQAQIPTSRQANLPLPPLHPLRLFILYIPNFDHLVHPTGGYTSTYVRVDI